MGELGEAKWYVVQAMSGQENRALKSLEHRCKIDAENGIDNGIRELVIPTEKVEDRRQGKKTVRERKLYPGYLLVKVRIFDEEGDLVPETWSIIKETQGVIGFIGGDCPVPLTETEVNEMRQQVQANEEKPKPKIQFQLGETIIIRDGAFENFEGLIESVDNDRMRLKVSVSIFGRSTPVEVEFWQVEHP